MSKTSTETESPVKNCMTWMKEEKVRYKRKGYGMIWATLFATSFFWIVPELIGQQMWPSILTFKEENNISYAQFYIIWSMLQHLIIFYGANLIYCFFYKHEFECIERYKSNEQPWPWISDPEQWKSLLWKSIALSGFNSCVVAPGMFYFNYTFNFVEEHTMEVKDLPTSFTLACTILFCMLCEDITFYCSHRLLH